MFKWLIVPLLTTFLLVLFGLVLLGFSSGESLAEILGLFAVARLITLGAEAFRKARPLEYWSWQLAVHAENYRCLAPEALENQAEALGLAPRSSPDEMARARVEAEIKAQRGKREIVAEMIGVLGYVLLLPGVVALYTHDFYSLRIRHEWPGFTVVVLAIVLYLWPHVWRSSREAVSRASLWWSVPFVPLLAFFYFGIAVRHPYLDPLEIDRAQLAANQVLVIPNNIVASNHADWVFDYARQLDRKGYQLQAANYYREGLRLKPNDREAQTRLTAIDASRGISTEGGLPLEAPTSWTAPYWSPDRPVKAAPRIKRDASLAHVSGCTVIVVPVGEVPEGLLDAVANTIEHELGLPAFVLAGSVPVPHHTRERGLITGKQWEAQSLWAAFQKAGEPLPDAPLRYLLITPLDIYLGESNFVFSAHGDWGGVVSFARYGEPLSDPLCAHRTAKQSLSALLKSLRVPASTDRGCVTSYVASLEELDLKGNRPNASSLALFQQRVAEINEGWKQSKGNERGDDSPGAPPLKADR